MVNMPDTPPPSLPNAMDARDRIVIYVKDDKVSHILYYADVKPPQGRLVTLLEDALAKAKEQAT